MDSPPVRVAGCRAAPERPRTGSRGRGAAARCAAGGVPALAPVRSLAGACFYQGVLPLSAHCEVRFDGFCAVHGHIAHTRGKLLRVLPLPLHVLVEYPCSLLKCPALPCAWLSVVHLSFFLFVSLFVPSMALAADNDSPAYDVWTRYQSSSISDFHFYQRVAEDLAYRWFMSPADKQVKVPLQSEALGSYPQLTEYRDDYNTAEEQWDAFYSDFHPSFIVRMYSLVSFEDSFSTWRVSDNYAYQHFKEWYDWFEGTGSSGGGSSDVGTGTPLNVFVPTIYWGKPSSLTSIYLFDSSSSSTYSPLFNAIDFESSNYEPDEYCYPLLNCIPLNASTGDIIRNWLAADYRVYCYVSKNGGYGSAWNGYVYLFMHFYAVPSDADLVTAAGTSTTRPSVVIPAGTSYKVLSALNTLRGRMYVGDTGLPTFVANRGFSFSQSSATAGESGFQIIPSVDSQPYFFGEISTSYSPVPTEPVYPPSPEVPTPDTPSIPDPSTPTPEPDPVDNPGTTTTVNQTINNITNNTTTVDLQPILDAIGVVNDNLKVVSRNFADYSTYMQGWSTRMYRMVYDWLSKLDADLTAWARSLYDMVYAWFQALTGQLHEWFGLFLGQLRLANRWLESIYYELTTFYFSYQPRVPSDITPSQQLGTDINKLKLKFPFSLPWDVWAMLKLLEAPPTTPVFTLWWPYTDGLVIDLSPLDDVAAVSRTMSLFVFTGGLLLRTKDMFID